MTYKDFSTIQRMLGMILGVALGISWFECSECGDRDYNAEMYEAMPFCNVSNYCPNCGARMDGAE